MPVGEVRVWRLFQSPGHVLRAKHHQHERHLADRRHVLHHRGVCVRRQSVRGPQRDHAERVQARQLSQWGNVHTERTGHSVSIIYLLIYLYIYSFICLVVDLVIDLLIYLLI